MKIKATAPAFTLVEMIIAITVFTIFIGFAISAYLSFHRADQEALVQRSLTMEAGTVMDTLTQDIKANKIDYTAYAANECTNSLCLISADGTSTTVYAWDSTTQALTVQKDGGELLPLTSEQVYLNAASFTVFPTADPYDPANVSDDSVQFQPLVTLDLIFAAEGSVREEVTVQLKTSVSSRFYQ